MWKALGLASRTGLLIVPAPKGRGVSLCESVLEVAPDASRDVVASLSVRRYLYPNGARSDERRVREIVERWGYEYVPLSSGYHCQVG